MIVLRPAIGGLLIINGEPGGKLQELTNANRGVPGKEMVPHPVNWIGLLIGK